MTNKFNNLLKLVGLICLTFVILFISKGCTSKCSHCKLKIRVINLPNGCNIRESLCKIGVGSKEELDAINKGIPTRITTKYVLRRNPSNAPENIGEFDIDCNKGVIISYMYIQFDDCCPIGSGNAFYYFNGLEVYSNIFKDDCEPTLTYDFKYDFIFSDCN